MTWRLPKGGSTDTTHFEYTVDGQMIKAYNDDIELQFAYDGIGNRIRKIIIEDSDTTVVKYTYDGADLLFECDGNDAVQIRYLYGPGIDHILESVDSVGTNQHFADALGSVSKITDNTGSILKKFTYDSFGNIVADSGSVIADDVTYTGREHESELGIYYYRARYYDPLTGRFMVRDPLGFAAGDVNLYRYVGNAPVNFNDPFGLERSYTFANISLSGGGFYIVSLETSIYAIIDFDTGEVHIYWSGSFGLGPAPSGFAYVTQYELGSIQGPDDPSCFGGLSWTVSGYAAAGFGWGGQFTGTDFWNENGIFGASSGPAIGGGASISGMATYSVHLFGFNIYNPFGIFGD
jgi:RHS repeat-associated protein